MEQNEQGDPCLLARAHVEKSLEVLANITEPELRLKALSKLARDYKVAGQKTSELRADTMRELNDLGHGYDTLAKWAGVSKGRVQQVLGKVRRTPRPGKIEYSFSLRATELRAQGYDAERIARALVPAIRSNAGGKLVSREKIAQILNCSLNDVTEYDTL